MYEIDKENFGTFLQTLRKEKGYTQKELAAFLFVSDKAVSKWERGLSLPDTSLLIPLGEALGVTVTELLKGEHLSKTAQLNIEDVEKLVTNTIDLSSKEIDVKTSDKKTWKLIYLCCIWVCALELFGIYLYDKTILTQGSQLLLEIGLNLVFGAWFCIWIKEKLPAYYDENKIRIYSDGIFSLNLAGLRLNNSNWPHIIKIGRLWTNGTLILFPCIYFIAIRLFPSHLNLLAELLLVMMTLGIFIPMIYVAKKYE